MKKFVLFCLLFWGCSSPNSHVWGILITQEHYTYIFDSPNSMIVDSVVNNPANDELYVLEIAECKKDWFFVNVYHPLSDSISHTGWIQYPNVGIYMRDFGYVKIYDLPSYDSSVKLELEHAEWGPYVVTGINGDWMQIELNYHGLKICGWLSPEHQSSNPYTTDC